MAKLTKLAKMAKQLNEQFREILPAAFEKKFNRKVTTSWNLFEMSLVTRAEDEQDFTPEQLAFIQTFSDGYEAAMVQVKDD